ncbi:hypothetical protein GCM10022225_27370 [Plantactinospora mayteni]|uniref:Transcriptional regulator n=1 Tax=Plantactinospora mayteni TaxID=566021 RepID=A0ABQ4EIH9_9ACTN|nr:tetratricopeptide repeat protein [Plantactinospora mayteni]GIG94533.1 hypothetical protein Pma05_11060 [Plantactinospora mayteni]
MDAEVNGLADAFHRAAITPRQFATKINEWMSAQGLARDRIHQTTPYSWLREGRRPRPITAYAAAAVLSDHLGVPITASQLWPDIEVGGRLERLPMVAVARSVKGEAQTLRELTAAAASRAGHLRMSTSMELAVAVEAAAGEGWKERPGEEQEDSTPLLPLVAAHTSGLRELFGTVGSDRVTRHYAGAELSALAAVAAEVPASDTLVVVADLAHLLGEMEFDAGRNGFAERYLLSALRLRYAAADHVGIAATLGTLAEVVCNGPQPEAARKLATRAIGLCPRGETLLRARLLTRAAMAAAANGDVRDFSAMAQVISGHLRMVDDHPERNRLTVESAHAATLLARRNPDAAEFLGSAVDVLSRVCPNSSLSARERLFYGLVLAEAQIMTDAVDEAATTVRAVSPLLVTVRSGRCERLRRHLREYLIRQARTPAVADAIADLEQVIGAQPRLRTGTITTPSVPPHRPVASNRGVRDVA